MLSRLLALSILLPLLAPAAQTGSGKASTVFPAVVAYNLEKTRVAFPDDFAGKLNLLLISFEREQQKDIDSWQPTAEAIQHMHPSFHYYYLPVSTRENMLYRWWMNSSMRGEDSDPETWRWIVPLYLDKDAFRRDLGLPDEKQTAEILVDKSGHVLWKAFGPAAADKRASLEAAVAAASGR